MGVDGSTNRHLRAYHDAGYEGGELGAMSGGRRRKANRSAACGRLGAPVRRRETRAYFLSGQGGGMTVSWVQV